MVLNGKVMLCNREASVLDLRVDVPITSLKFEDQLKTKTENSHINNYHPLLSPHFYG